MERGEGNRVALSKIKRNSYRKKCRDKEIEKERDRKRERNKRREGAEEW